MTSPARNVLITGASSGIGAACAEHLAAKGLRVFGTSRKPRATAGDGIEWVELDVCNDASVAAGIADAEQRSGGLDAVVCNAGYGIYGSVEETSIDDARAQFETNYFGLLRCLRSVLPVLRERGHGRVVLVGSIAGRAPIPFQSHYSASKAAVQSTLLTLHNELQGSGVSVSLVEPGDIDTPFNDAMDWGTPASSAYGEKIARVETTIRESLPKSPKPIVVAKAVEHALTSSRPRLRYPVGSEALLVGFASRMLPDRLNMWFIRQHFGI